MSAADQGAPRALAAGVGCYVIWGLAPLVFQVLGRMGISVWEIVAHRTVWAVPAAAVFVLLARQGGQVAMVMRNPKMLAWLGLSSLTIAANWAIFISAANHGRLLETSLAYYINPLLIMAIGALFFGERMDRFGQVAILLATVGVALQALAIGYLPWVPVVLAVTFAAYGVIKKQAPVDAQAGFLVECLFLAAPGAAYALWLGAQGQSHFGQSAASFWLMACGPLTAAPLVLFAWATRRLTLSAMGFLQFIAPTMTLAIGVLQGEPFSPMRGVSFAFIWAGVALYVWNVWRRTRTLGAAQAYRAA